MEDARNPAVGRRKFLRYAAVTGVAAAIAGAGYYYLGSSRKPIPEPTTLRTSTVTTATTAPASTLVNPVIAEYGDAFPPEIIEKIQVLGEDYFIDENEKLLLDSLSDLEVRRKDLEEAYHVTNLEETLADLCIEGKTVSAETGAALRYLNRNRTIVQLGLIDYSLDTTAFDWLKKVVRRPDIAAVNTDLVYEMARLKDFTRDGELVDFVFESSQNEKYKPAFEAMLNTGIPRERRQCTPLEALAWIYADQEAKTITKLKTYATQRFIRYAWTQTSTSRNYASDRWTSYDEARDRVNTPELVNMFVNDYFKFDMKRNGVHPQGPRLTYEVRRGVCRHAAYVSTDFLGHNGYDARNVTVIWGPNEGHTVGTVELEGGLWIVVDFRGTNLPMVGPFSAYSFVERYLGQSFNKKIQKSYIEFNIGTMTRNSDIESY